MRKSLASLDDFQHKLVSWYSINKRPLPWRETTDPYRILVSETMLQQTRVDTVIPYFHRFLEAFPDFHSLAAAQEAQVMKLWQGLGYYARARNLQRTAQVVVAEHGGKMPAMEALIRALPGIGPYTAGAVLSIAFNQPLAAVDGNVLRVIARYLGIVDPIDSTPVKAQITAYVQAAVERSEPRLFTQALMELGAVVCTPRNAQCLLCPLTADCQAKALGKVAELPNKKPKKGRKQMTVAALWIEQDGQLLVERRAADGLLAGMWQLPAVEFPAGDTTKEQIALAAAARLKELIQGDTDNEVATSVHEPLQEFAQIASARHIFTHVEWHLAVVRPVGYPHRYTLLQSHEHRKFVPIDELKQLVWPKVYENILHDLLAIDVATAT